MTTTRALVTIELVFSVSEFHYQKRHFMYKPNQHLALHKLYLAMWGTKLTLYACSRSRIEPKRSHAFPHEALCFIHLRQRSCISNVSTSM